MCGNTDKDFNHRSKIRLLDPSRVPNSTHTRLGQEKSVSTSGPNKSQDSKGRRGKTAGS